MKKPGQVDRALGLAATAALRLHGDLGATAGGKDTIGARLGEVELLLDVQDINCFATRFQAVVQAFETPNIIRMNGGA